MTQSDDIVLSARGISKSFPGVRALNEVDLDLHRGKLTALLGENGAGKSTLMSILAGVFPPDEGRIILRGSEVSFQGPLDAQQRGIAMIFQELNLIPNLTIAENIFIGREPTNWLGLIDYPLMNQRATKLLEELEMNVPPDTIVGALRVGQQQVIEIARAISYDPAVIIMDEPTSALTQHEVEVLFSLISRLKSKGVAIAYITHKFEELAHICDDAVILRDGKRVGAGRLADLSREAIVRFMVGRDLAEPVPKSSRPPGEEILRIENVSLRNANRPGDWFVREINLSVRTGEVLGIFGLMGAGRTELLETLFGLHADEAEGDIYIGGELARINSPMDAIAHGLALAPEDRKREGLVLSMNVAENLSLASLSEILRGFLIDSARERRHVEQYIDRFQIKTPSIKQTIRNLSGGNQQKVILAKWLAAKPKILLLDEPTRGIDVHAKREIYRLIHELAGIGLAVIVVSSELEEILAISDRVMVMCEGRKSAEMPARDANQENIMSAALPTAPLAEV